MEAERIIVYRGRGEQYADEFLYDMALPWIYDHWYVVLIVGFAIFLWYKLVNRRNY